MAVILSKPSVSCASCGPNPEQGLRDKKSFSFLEEENHAKNRSHDEEGKEQCNNVRPKGEVHKK